MFLFIHQLTQMAKSAGAIHLFQVTELVNIAAKALLFHAEIAKFLCMTGAYLFRNM